MRGTFSAIVIERGIGFEVRIEAVGEWMEKL